MLHVVPALILLILQGPSGVDGLPCHRGLPAALQALNSRLEPAARGAVKASSRDAAIASLLALGAKDPRWSAAIAKFLEGAGLDAASPIPAEVLESRRQSDRAIRILDPAAPVPRPLFATCSRFRDGPHSG